jgi:hypothetical protein
MNALDKNKPVPFRIQEEIINSFSNDSITQRKSDCYAHKMYMSTGNATKRNDEGDIVSKYLPTSLRNRILYFWRKSDYTKVFELISPDSESCVPKSSARKRSAARTNKEHQHFDTSEETHLNNMPSYPFSPFVKFQQLLVGKDGIFKWRIHNVNTDVFAMNNIDINSGNLQKNQFVHVWRWSASEGRNEPNYFCQCSMYAAASRMSGFENTASRCCHVRFLHQCVEPIYASLFSPTSVTKTPMMSKIENSLESLNVPVVRLDNDKQFHRYSVLSSNMLSCSIVNLQGNRLSCKDGKCRSMKGHTRKISSLGDQTNCEHLVYMSANKEQWQQLCEDSQDQCMVDDDQETTEETNNETRAQVCI